MKINLELGKLTKIKNIEELCLVLVFVGKSFYYDFADKALMDMFIDTVDIYKTVCELLQESSEFLL